MKQEYVFTKSAPKNIKELTQKIKLVMLDHIGMDNEITKMELFRKVLGNPAKYNELQEFFLWDKMRKSMNFLRKTTYCFIASRRVHEGIWAYFVIKSQSDLQYYKDNLRVNINRMYSMIQRGQKIVDQRGYKKYIKEMKE